MAAQLPEGWQQHEDPQGRVFYFNTATSESTYDPPWGAQGAAAPPPPPMPEGWSAMIDPSSGRTYYHNAGTGETTWNPPAAAANAGRWSLEQTYGLGPEGFEHFFEGRARLLERSYNSVSATVEALSSGDLVVEEGICVLYSGSRSLYYLLWRDDKADYAKTFFMWSCDQAICLGPVGHEDAFEGIVQLLPKDEFVSVSETVSALNLGQLSIDEGCCVVFSDAQQLYFLLYRTDKEADITSRFPPWQSPDDDQ
mmetsp:Transcript_73023/g.205121  ORF Transcript_73023/g.205121 Transcript_73023/m.205121 type:complete len:253 (+) Transcript_73023:94-852(+)